MKSGRALPAAAVGSLEYGGDRPSLVLYRADRSHRDAQSHCAADPDPADLRWLDRLEPGTGGLAKTGLHIRASAVQAFFDGYEAAGCGADVSGVSLMERLGCIYHGVKWVLVVYPVVPSWLSRCSTCSGQNAAVSHTMKSTIFSMKFIMFGLFWSEFGSILMQSGSRTAAAT